MQTTSADQDRRLCSALGLLFLDNPDRYSPSFGRFEIAFSDAADGADPIFGNVFKSRAGRDAAVGIALGRIVNVTANGTDVFLHVKSPLSSVIVDFVGSANFAVPDYSTFATVMRRSLRRNVKFPVFVLWEARPSCCPTRPKIVNKIQPRRVLPLVLTISR